MTKKKVVKKVLTRKCSIPFNVPEPINHLECNPECPVIEDCPYQDENYLSLSNGGSSYRAVGKGCPWYNLGIKEEEQCAY